VNAPKPTSNTTTQAIRANTKFYQADWVFLVVSPLKGMAAIVTTDHPMQSEDAQASSIGSVDNLLKMV